MAKRAQKNEADPTPKKGKKGAEATAEDDEMSEAERIRAEFAAEAEGAAEDEGDEGEETGEEGVEEEDFSDLEDGGTGEEEVEVEVDDAGNPIVVGETIITPTTPPDTAGTQMVTTPEGVVVHVSSASAKVVETTQEQKDAANLALSADIAGKIFESAQPPKPETNQEDPTVTSADSPQTAQTKPNPFAGPPVENSPASAPTGVNPATHHNIPPPPTIASNYPPIQTTGIPIHMLGNENAPAGPDTVPKPFDPSRLVIKQTVTQEIEVPMDRSPSIVKMSGDGVVLRSLEGAELHVIPELCQDVLMFLGGERVANFRYLKEGGFSLVTAASGQRKEFYHK